MSNLKAVAGKLMKDEHGSEALEYAVIAGLIVAGALGVNAASR
jgi:Flp pilus assembly pilin Flp